MLFGRQVSIVEFWPSSVQIKPLYSFILLIWIRLKRRVLLYCRGDTRLSQLKNVSLEQLPDIISSSAFIVTNLEPSIEIRLWGGCISGGNSAMAVC